MALGLRAVGNARVVAGALGLAAGSKEDLDVPAPFAATLFSAPPGRLAPDHRRGGRDHASHLNAAYGQAVWAAVGRVLSA